MMQDVPISGILKIYPTISGIIAISSVSRKKGFGAHTATSGKPKSLTAFSGKEVPQDITTISGMTKFYSYFLFRLPIINAITVSRSGLIHFRYDEILFLFPFPVARYKSKRKILLGSQSIKINPTVRTQKNWT